MVVPSVKESLTSISEIVDTLPEVTFAVTVPLVEANVSLAVVVIEVSLATVAVPL